MRWDDFRRSDNVEDDRDGGGGLAAAAAVSDSRGRRRPRHRHRRRARPDRLGARHRSEHADRRRGNRRPAVAAATSSLSAAEHAARTGAPKDQMGDFVAAVLGNTEDTWTVDFPSSRAGNTARRACGCSRRRAGRLRLRAGGDGPVLLPDRPAHLSRHLVLPRHAGALPRLQRQGLRIRRGLCDRARGRPSRAEPARHSAEGAVAQQRAAGSKAEANRIQVRVELQADCFAGIWAHRSNQQWKSIEPGDVEAALQTAAAIGDDRLQQQSRGYVVPDAFTHGSSAQRQRWFTTGLKEGKAVGLQYFCGGVTVRK